MPTTLESITHEMLELPGSQRLALARIILDLDSGPPDADVEEAWDKEIRARLKAYDEGKLETVPFEQLKNEIDAGLRRASENNLTRRTRRPRRI